MGDADIAIKTSYLLAIAKWASTDESRNLLEHVVFGDGKILATDGHRLCICKYDTKGMTFGVERRAIFAVAAAQDAFVRHWSPLATMAGVDLEADDDGGTVIQSRDGNREVFIRREPDGAIRFEIGTGIAMRVRSDLDLTKYPPVEDLLAQPVLGEPPARGFQPRYLADIQDLVAASGYGSYGVRVESWSNELGPMQFVCPNSIESGDDYVRMVLMPMRSMEEAAGKRRKAKKS